jgi:hypothetical protein
MSNCTGGGRDEGASQLLPPSAEARTEGGLSSRGD